MISLRVRRFIAVVCAIVTIHPAMSAPNSPPPQTPEQEAMAATQAACDAFRLRDIPALERLLAPEFTLVNTSAEVQSRARAIQEVRDGDPQYDRFENHSMSARVYGDTAIVQGITSLKGRSGGKPFAVDVRFTDHLVRIDGKWSITLSHVTRIPS